MVFSVPECPDRDSLRRKAYDEDVVSTIVGKICAGIDLTNAKVTRVGTRSEDKIRPIKVKMERECDARGIVVNARKLRNSTEFKNVVISSDKTPREQTQYRNLRKQLSERRSNGEKNLQIRYVNGTPRIVGKEN